MPHHQWRTKPRSDQQIGMRAESYRQRKCAAQAWQDRTHGGFGTVARLYLSGNEVSHHFAVGFAFECPTRRRQFGAQFLEILDDPVVHDRDFGGGVRVRVGRRGGTMRCPAGVGDANRARRGIFAQHLYQIGQLALCAAAHHLTVIQGTDPGGVIAAILHPPEAIDQPVGNTRLANNPDNAAHCFWSFPCCQARWIKAPR